MAELESIYNAQHPRAVAVLAMGLLEGIVDDAFERHSDIDIVERIWQDIDSKKDPFKWPEWTIGSLAKEHIFKASKEDLSAAEKVEVLLKFGQLPSLITRSEFRDLWQYRNQIHLLREADADALCTLGIALAALSALSLTIEHRRHFRYFDNRDWTRVSGVLVHCDKIESKVTLESIDANSPAVIVTDPYYGGPVRLSFDATLPDGALLGIVFNFRSFQEEFDCIRLDTRTPDSSSIADQGLMRVRERWLYRDFPRRFRETAKAQHGTHAVVVELHPQTPSLRMGDRTFILEGDEMSWGFNPALKIGLLAEQRRVTIKAFRAEPL